eukprot:359646-Chlamydomonas_euryale.AAC.1
MRRQRPLHAAPALTASVTLPNGHPTGATLPNCPATDVTLPNGPAVGVTLLNGHPTGVTLPNCPATDVTLAPQAIGSNDSATGASAVLQTPRSNILAVGATGVPLGRGLEGSRP